MDQVNDATLNTDGGSSVPLKIGDLISTTEFTSKPGADADPEGANNTKGTAKTGSANEDGKETAGKDETKSTEGKETPSGDDDRFDKHPRFVELRTKAETAEKRVEKLESQLSQLMASTKAPKADEQKELPYKDVSKMTNDQILDWQSEDPVGYHKNLLAQAKYELSQEFEQKFEQTSSENAIVSTYETFAKANPDFDAMWDRGELQKFMEANPGHNAISAYREITHEAAIKKAVADAEKKFTANQRAKRENKSLGGGPQTTGSSTAPVSPELQDSNKFGGPIKVLADRLRARRAQAGL